MIIAQNEWTSLAIHDCRNGKFEWTSAFNKLCIREERASFGPQALIKLIRTTSLAQKLQNHGWNVENEMIYQRFKQKKMKAFYELEELSLCIWKLLKNRHFLYGSWLWARFSGNHQQNPLNHGRNILDWSCITKYVFYKGKTTQSTNESYSVHASPVILQTYDSISSSTASKCPENNSHSVRRLFATWTNQTNHLVTDLSRFSAPLEETESLYVPCPSFPSSMALKNPSFKPE